MHDDNDDERDLPDASDLEAPGETDLLDACPNCHRLMYDDSERCPHCGHYLSAETDRPHGLGWLAVCVLIFLIIATLVWFR